MYSAKEKLYHFRQLANPLAAEADLSLLHGKNPQSTDFTRFDLAPRKNAEDILFALLDVADHDDIVRNRREFFSQQPADNEPPTNPDGNPVVDGEGSENPTNPDGNPVVDGEGSENPTNPDGNPVVDGEGSENPTNPDGNPVVDGEGSENPTDPKDTPVESPVDNSTEEGGEDKSPKKPVTPKKKKKSTRK